MADTGIATYKYVTHEHEKMAVQYAGLVLGRPRMLLDYRDIKK